ncbi:54S ribosomal protein img2, mitochondrial [Paecilomyces lecythidis]|uniref:Large ribosomal subunit protein mL49 n=1 Tax=Paecilomyces lecythidis TaxID=3004212 RepID=A0ABR3YA18_9EURO
MASLLPSSSLSSAIRRQSSSLSLNLTSTQIAVSTRRFSTIPISISHSGQTQSQNLLQSPSRPSFSRTALPIQQSRTFLAKLTRRSPATAERHSSPAPTTPVNPQTQAQAPPLQLTNLPYFVRRTPSNQLPVYLVTKAGGTKQQTKIQKTEGDLEALRSDLARALGLESGDSRKSPDVTINRLNGHIIVKGWRKPEIQKFLLERNF